MVDRSGELQEIATSLQLREMASSCCSSAPSPSSLLLYSLEELSEVATGAEFHDEEHLSGRVEDLEEADDVGLVDVFQEVFLSLVSPEDFSSGQVDYFYRIAAAGRQRFSDEDFSGGSSAQECSGEAVGGGDGLLGLQHEVTGDGEGRLPPLFLELSCGCFLFQVGEVETRATIDHTNR